MQTREETAALWSTFVNRLSSTRQTGIWALKAGVHGSDVSLIIYIFNMFISTIWEINIIYILILIIISIIIIIIIIIWSEYMKFVYLYCGYTF